VLRKTLVRFRSWIVGLGFCTFALNGFADTPHLGIGLSFPIITKDPEYLHAYQLSGWYQPKSLVWQHTRIYFDVSAGHWWVTNTDHNHSLNIYSVSPILRYYFIQNRYASPFLNLGIGFSYLSRTRIDSQNLGMHFSFQDQLGLGASFGQKQQLSVILSGLHYSNGSLCSMNAGITVPLMATLQYGF
jgi:hypothetical protein